MTRVPRRVDNHDVNSGAIEALPTLIERAMLRFEEMGLLWHAEQTRKVLA